MHAPRVHALEVEVGLEHDQSLIGQVPIMSCEPHPQ